MPQWDLHLIATYEHRNFLGGLRRLHLEERPRLLFLGQFPQVPDNSPRFGNLITANFSQPGFIEARTTAFVETSWDHGPDPFLLFFRDNVGISVGLIRGFFKQRLNVRVAVHLDVLQVDNKQPVLQDEIDNATPEELNDGSILPKSYRLPFLEQQMTIDLRDDPVEPTRGAYFAFNAQEACSSTARSWNYLRMAPDARGYAPLGLGHRARRSLRTGRNPYHQLIAETRHALAGARTKPLPTARRWRQQQPRLQSRPSGRRAHGGIRRWEASLELRVPDRQELLGGALLRHGRCERERPTFASTT